MALELSRAVHDALLAEARCAAPEEACGILLGQGGRISGLIPTRNVHARPETHFEIDPRALIGAWKNEREGGPAVAGFYHSHPNGLAQPSATDRAQAARDGRIWGIVAAGDVSFWRDGEAGFTPLSYLVNER
ncbi:M67 family metallopeptidase [Leptolyngbya sp. 15MV]|nr:M67 family metallopeptidase [Leptolyngbya sp. 15MV]